ncbi:MAG TPA: YggS family pyridoxal phosphate-dependent enzyme [Clostridia bacterium]|nr:YggS family pyridoxal phosphate-dependent enzyme [Clostridia bacterium]
MSITENVGIVMDRIARAAERAGRRGDDIKLVAATKTVPVEAIQEAIAAGVSIIGENRVQELIKKAPLLPRGIEMHMIGRLQANKAKKALEYCSMIQSLDRLSLAEELSRRAKVLGKEARVLVEVNVGREENKGGVDPDLGTLEDFLERISRLGGLSVEGLMAIPPLTSDPEEVRPFFRRLRELRDALADRVTLPGIALRELSMGMSADFEIAIEEGATMVRIGTALFGRRPPYA